MGNSRVVLASKGIKDVYIRAEAVGKVIGRWTSHVEFLFGEARNRETTLCHLSSASLSFVPLTLTGIGDEQQSTGPRKFQYFIRRLRIEVARSIGFFSQSYHFHLLNSVRTLW